MKRLIISIVMASALLMAGLAVTPSFTMGVAHADGGGGSE